MFQLMGIIAAAAALLAAAPAWAQRADLIYHNYCSVCHGDRGDGRSRARGSLDPAPTDFTTAEARKMLTRSRMLLAVKYGRPGTAMTSWATQLSDKEMEAVIDYIRDTMMAPEPGSPLARGRALYGHHCIACHGERGQGVASSPSQPAPRPFARDADRAQMVAAVAGGRFGAVKHDFAAKLKPQEIENTVDYVRRALSQASLGDVSGTRAHGGRGRDAGGVSDPLAPMPEGLQGNARRGKRLYAQNCVACHGAAGDGKGPRSALLGAAPRDFAALAYNRPALYAAIAGGRQGTDMPAWKAVLDRQALADVTEHVWATYFTGKAEAGRAIYNYRCYFCHGYSGDARTLAASMIEPPPRDFTRAQGLDERRALAAVRHGIPGSAMTSFAGTLSPREMELVARFVVAEFVTARAPNTRYHTAQNGWPGHERYAAAFPFVKGEVALDRDAASLSESERAGRRLYLGACISCHDRATLRSEGPAWQ